MNILVQRTTCTFGPAQGCNLKKKTLWNKAMSLQRNFCLCCHINKTLLKIFINVQEIHELQTAQPPLTSPTQPDVTLFSSKSIWTRPQGSKGCLKIVIFFLQIKLLSSCTRIEPKLRKLGKTVKIKKKSSKMPVFWQFFKLSAI